MQLDLSSLKKSIASLKEAWQKFSQNDSDTFVRDSVIQRFEYTYELSYKMTRRALQYLSHNGGAVSAMDFADVIRTANEAGFLFGSLKNWVNYREKRNITSHIYDEDKAKAVLSIIPDFIKEADFLFSNLEKKFPQI